MNENDMTEKLKMSDYSILNPEELITELKNRDKEIQRLRSELEKIKPTEDPITQCSSIDAKETPKPFLESTHDSSEPKVLDNDSIARYSRQLILPEFGPTGQKKLQNTSVLIVGCGGLGCPAAIYLAAAGIARLGLVDYDVIELSNLHRQILHTENGIGLSKADSIVQSVRNLNSKVQCSPYKISLNSSTISSIITDYNIVLDCTDNVATRYLLNDACVLNKKPLISGSALRFDGQLTIYNYEDGPCYRCLFPIPPPQETVTNCSDGGVIGVVPGIIGCLQALECIKLICGLGTLCHKKLLMFDGLNFAFRIIKLRNRQDSCSLCGLAPTIHNLIDYEQFCGAKATDKDKGLTLLNANERMNVEQYKLMISMQTPHLLIDVRLPIEMEICKLRNSVNIPLKNLDNDTSGVIINEYLESANSSEIVCVCRKGNDSQKAVRRIKEIFADSGLVVRDIIGGLNEWASKIDCSFPTY